MLLSTILSPYTDKEISPTWLNGFCGLIWLFLKVNLIKHPGIPLRLALLNYLAWKLVFSFDVNDTYPNFFHYLAYYNLH